MKVINEFKCPNCKKIIQNVRLRNSYIKRKKHKRGASYKVVRGVYKLIIKSEDTPSQTNTEKGK